MHPINHHLATILLAASLTSAYSIPGNLAQIYNDHRTKTCDNIIASGFSDGTTGDTTFEYCGDIPNAIFLHSSSNGGQYDNMDVDCDGAHASGGDCGDDPSIQGQTSFQDQVVQYGISDLDANVHPYVVFGNTNFDPQSSGMQPLSVMAVVCGGQLYYGVWGDMNGGGVTGEASIALAKLCFPGEGITGDNGHTADDVLYIGFEGQNAVPGSSADWTATDTQTFEDSIKSLGDQLVAGLGS
ncbi:putative fungal chitosanase [Aspergillus heteromorphus CBS 117.55]|uniref:Endo-chitosanase n=1 Tax=Aspergillus heteromorphus CBS 117.55 TaxID=1448321 RepID=A0A317WR02_9EURO|nr:putative fungal chitosanase [Aspergillus heteromorphus CBS 117.55]PWY87547.1 putative fungal chitosanase [Aspergillus heteromorphus CBS 117.55]